MNTTKYVFPNIAAEMARRGETLQTLSGKRNKSYQTVSARLTGKRSFELPEIHKLMEIYQEEFATLNWHKQFIKVVAANYGLMDE